MRIMTGGEEAVLVASCFGDEDTGGGLFTLDGNGVERVDRLSSQGLAVAGDRVLRVIRSAREVGGAGELLVYDERGVERYLRIDELADPHDVAWDGRHFVAVSTFTNEILWIEPSGRIARRWRAPGEGDCWHLNSLLLTDGRVYVSAFGRYGRHREWASRRDDLGGFVLDVGSGEEAVRGLSTPHNPRLVDGAWIVCNSGSAEVVEVDGDGRRRRTVQLAGWTRGLAISDDLLFVGESTNRGDLSSRASASIAVLSRDTWEVVDRIPVPVREIYDLVLVPPALVEGLRRGFRTNAARVAEEGQLALFSRAGVEPVRLWATGEPLRPDACRVTITTDVPASLPPDAVREIPCTVENRGGAILVSLPPNPVVLSYRWFEPASGLPLDRAISLHSSLPTAAHPGQPLPCSFKLLAPPFEGEFLLRVTLLQERVAWFDDLDESNAWSGVVRVTASA